MIVRLVHRINRKKFYNIKKYMKFLPAKFV